jgi:glutaredoxin
MPYSRRSIFVLVLMLLAISAASQWWSRRHQAGLGAQMAALARPGDIRMLSSHTCAICVTARQWLKRHGVPFSECFIETDRACAAQFEAARAPGTPVLLVRGQALLGFDPLRVLGTLDASPS